MTKFYLHLRDGDQFTEDRAGGEYANLDAAVAEAEAGAREILAEMLKHGEPLDGQRIEIADTAGSVVKVVTFKDVFRLR